MKYDSTLEEVWRIKREIGASFSSLEEYFKGMLDNQEASRSRGVKFVSFAPKTPV